MIWEYESHHIMLIILLSKLANEIISLDDGYIVTKSDD